MTRDAIGKPGVPQHFNASIWQKDASGMPNEQSPEQKSRERRNKYLLKKFDITLDEKEHMAALQRGLCLVCGGPLDAHGPSNVDHYHAHLTSYRLGSKMWSCWIEDEAGQQQFHYTASTKAAAVQVVKARSRRWSIRGLLCAKCNKGLGYVERFFDAARHPENLDAIKAYFVRRLENITRQI